MPDAPDDLFLSFQQALAGRYSLERELGRGGMGVVYLARDVRLDRLVALKLLPPGLAKSPGLRERFVREARLAARLGHPNIVPIHAVEEAGRFVYFVMAFVDGETLGARIRREGRLPPAETARILREVAWALAYAHAQGLVHRDIKPDNILLEREGGRVLVVDFGIATAGGADDAKGLGTPDYMSPEQAAGDALDGRSDLYALGAVGFHCLAGRPPFRAAWVKDLLLQHITTPAPPVASVAPGVPAELARVVDRALAKRPEDRFPTGEAMAEALGRRGLATLDLPVPLRVWVERGRELKAVYTLWSLGMFGLGIMAFAASARTMGHPAWGAVAVLWSAGALPWVGHFLWRIGETRKVLRAGATLEDLRRAVAVHRARRTEELAYEAARRPHWFPRLVRAGTYLSFNVALAGLGGGALWPDGQFWFSVFGLGALGTALGGTFGLLYPGREVRPMDLWAELRVRYYRTGFGRLMTRLAGLGLGREPAPPLLERPTELAVGAATAALWESLPAGQRQPLADLPTVVHRLERHARAAREATMAEADAGPAARRLAEVVAALEMLRIGLLRLKAGEVGAGEITADLEAARELGERMDRLVAGRAEVDRLLADPRPTPV